MWAYIVRRLLWMIPLLFGMSFVNFLIINLAPAPRSSNVQGSGDLDLSSSMEANEGEHIFRQTFYLDRPIFYNDRYSLQDTEIFWKVATPLREWTAPPDRSQAQYDLDDYGRVIVPHLIRIAMKAAHEREELAVSVLRSDYERRWKKERRKWIKDGKPPGVVVWPPPEEAPAFDDAACNRLLTLTLARLANNAPRRPTVLYGEAADPELLARNKEIRLEQTRLRRIFKDASTTDVEKLGLWEQWYWANADEWAYSGGDKARMFLLETRFAKFWSNLAEFDLGTSFTHRKKVWDLILERLPVSLTLSFGSLILAYLISIPLGILSAVTHRSASDVVISWFLFVLYSLPIMFLGLLLIIHLAIRHDIFPAGGFRGPDYAELTVLNKIRDVSWHLVLPMTTMTAGALAFYSRYMKAGLIEIIRADFIRTARAKGISEFVVVMKHALRNGLIPIITLLGSSLPAVISGSILVEYLFEIDGMGRLAWQAVQQNDFAVIMGLNILTAVLTMIGIFLADIGYAIADPRISYK